MDEIILGLEIPLDNDGFLDRQCANNRCRRYFKVLYSDWDASDELVFTCPFCGQVAEASDFNTEEQEVYLVEVGQAVIQEKLQQMLAGVEKSIRSNASSKSMIKIDVTTKFNQISVPISLEATESMRLQIKCEYCGCTYAVVGAGFFCPICGRNSAPHTFRQAIQKSRIAVSVAESLRSSLGDPDTNQVMRVDIYENQIEDLVTSFQRLSDSIYPDLPDSTNAKKNSFQRLEPSSNFWEQAGGRSFESILDSGEWLEVLRYFQKRHVLTHSDGFVDTEYIAKTGDNSYKVGQKLIISAADVIRMATLVEKLASGMIDDLPSTIASSETATSEPNVKLFPPTLPGTTEQDWTVYRVICEQADVKDHDNLHDDDVLPILEKMELDEDAIVESLEILKAKGLVQLSHTLGSRVARHIRVTQRGLELYFSYLHHDFKERRKQLADLLLEDVNLSGVIADRMGMPLLFVHNIIREFESRGWVKVQWSGGVAFVHTISSAHLKRM